MAISWINISGLWNIHNIHYPLERGFENIQTLDNRGLLPSFYLPNCTLFMVHIHDNKVLNIDVLHMTSRHNHFHRCTNEFTRWPHVWLGKTAFVTLFITTTTPRNILKIKMNYILIILQWYHWRIIRVRLWFILLV